MKKEQKIKKGFRKLNILLPKWKNIINLKIELNLLVYKIEIERDGKCEKKGQGPLRRSDICLMRVYKKAAEKMKR